MGVSSCPLPPAFFCSITQSPIIYREEDELMSGAVMKAMIQPGEGGDTPSNGSLVCTTLDDA